MAGMSTWMMWTSKSLTPRRVSIPLWNHQLKCRRHLHPCRKRGQASKSYISGLRELGAPIYGTKDVLFRRLCEYEHIAAKKEEEEYLESRRKELAVAT